MKQKMIINSLLMLLVFAGVLSAQLLDSKDIAIQDLRATVENASRSQQIVWVEDFTGLN
tara:strand:- start:359 stop:535 length:177 start_codon:yes stop_codon:yes gene_type:complete